MKISRTDTGDYFIGPESSDEAAHLEWLLHRVFMSKHQQTSNCGMGIAAQSTAEPDPPEPVDTLFRKRVTAIRDEIINTYKTLAAGARTVDDNMVLATAERIENAAIHTASSVLTE